MEQLFRRELIMPMSEERAQFARKIIPSGMLPAIRRKHNSERIVLVSGVFDVLHSGHVDFLLDAREKGDKLIVGVNSDSSVAELKGFNRPIIEEQRRTQVLASMGMVDYVFLFDEINLAPYLEKLHPDVYVTSSKSVVPNKPEFLVAENLGISVAISQLRGDEDSTTIIVDRVMSQRVKQ